MSEIKRYNSEYCELKEKEFRSLKTLNKFMKKNDGKKVVSGYQIIGKIRYQLQLTHEGFKGVYDV